MLESIAVILIVLWLLGLLTSYSLGGLIHILLVIAVMTVNHHARGNESIANYRY
jgi:hypothetical protein